MARPNLTPLEDSLLCVVMLGVLLTVTQPVRAFLQQAVEELVWFLCHEMCNSQRGRAVAAQVLQAPSPRTAINSLLLFQQNCGSGLCSIFVLILYASVLTLFYILLLSSCSSVSAIFRHLPLSGWHHCKFSAIKGIISELCQWVKTSGLCFSLTPTFLFLPCAIGPPLKCGCALIIKILCHQMPLQSH